MADTTNLKLPMLQAAQAQKHVTVNEGLIRLDGLVQMVLRSVTETVPPSVVLDGHAYAVPVGAQGVWSGADGMIAIGSNGGWEFVAPSRGWRGHVLDAAEDAIHDGTDWAVGQSTASLNGAGLCLRVAEIDCTISPGPFVTTPPIIPANAVVMGVTGRVITQITGSLASWRLGNPSASGRYGNGLGLAAGSFVHGVLGQPTTFYSDEPLLLEAVGGVFASGVVRFAVHFFELTLPRP